MDESQKRAVRVLIREDPYLYLNQEATWFAERGVWPCKWICCPNVGHPPFVTAYRKTFTLNKDATVRAHVSADERYELFVDGERMGRGPERGDRFNWFYETYDLPLRKGEHVIVARVWSLGDKAPYAQMSVRPGFMFATEGEFIEFLGTGVAEWEAKKLGGYEFVDPAPAWGTGANLRINGAEFDWGFEKGEGDGWTPAEALHNGANGFIRNEYPPIHLMKPATLPPMLERPIPPGELRSLTVPSSEDTRTIAIRGQENLPAEYYQWSDMLSGRNHVAVPPFSARRAIVDLGDYCCAYPEIVTSGGGGSRIRVHWAEALFNEPEGRTKGNRNETEGKYFVGVGDTFMPDGAANRKFETLWWQAGRYIEIVAQTANEPLTIESFGLRETHYPVEMESSFESSDPRLAQIIPIGFRTLQMCSHETFMDCPYYEQLQYIGDTRLQTLVTYITTRDDRLPRKALRTFDASRLISGITQSRYPSRVTQIIPPFSLWWIGMVHDFALWRDDLAFVKSLMPGVRAVLDCWLTWLNDDGLIEGPNGWNFMDWVPGWTWGVPPDGEFGVNGSINWLFVQTLAMAAELEEYAGEIEMAARARRLASEQAARVSAAFWHEGRNLFAEDLARQHFSEHAQCLAILSGQLDKGRQTKIAESLLTADDLYRTTIYFTHYLFEAYRVLGRIDALFDRLSLWFDLEKQGFKTTFECPEPSRSDCHAWGAHPIYHYYATVLGIRPASMGFRTVKIEPQLGPLTSAKGKLVHPNGLIEVDLRVEDGEVKGGVVVPKRTGVTQHSVSGLEL